jgi:F-type H+-transporting ATPase subunit b
MSRYGRAAWALLLPCVLLAAGPALARTPAGDHASARSGRSPRASHAAPGSRGTAQGESVAHGAGHAPGFDDVNWIYGLLGEADSTLCGWLGAEPGDPPNVLCRPKGMGVPMLALVFNSGLLLFLFVFYGRRPLREALRRRREGILRGMKEASQMREEAEARLSAYRDKLQHIDDEIERLKREMRAAGEAERERILAEAREKHARMQRDARLVLAQELKATRQELRDELIRAAAAAARDALETGVSQADHQRLNEEFLAHLRKSVHSLGGRL